ncbi:cyclopropane-fatty-acyl-phospholipid synthase [Bacillus sp. FJAT-27225]|uniref:DUF1292 domain-containing protein n=1 Tax=Bacillus sp. FJAT-27225 TaxID=1743144 RepID=UPI00080C2AC1|nr:DUF1292 domain-containing protein [Bacillus sp. FJAT-27225]OCA90720.1 cyclopropane-fatty-acyl-phospholipid synthase [Bacillus sp. FJAT-27225]
MEKIEVGEIFTIADENDQEQQVEVLAVMELEGTEYVAVSFIEDLEEDTEDDIDIFFLKVDDEGDLDAIQTDEEFEKVAAEFERIMDQEEADES